METIENTWFQVTLYGEGWDRKLTNKDDQYTTSPSKTIVGRVKGKNPVYGATCACIVGSAVMIATEINQLPGNGK